MARKRKPLTAEQKQIKAAQERLRYWGKKYGVKFTLEKGAKVESLSAIRGDTLRKVLEEERTNIAQKDFTIFTTTTGIGGESKYSVREAIDLETKARFIAKYEHEREPKGKPTEYVQGGRVLSYDEADAYITNILSFCDQKTESYGREVLGTLIRDALNKTNIPTVVQFLKEHSEELSEVEDEIIRYEDRPGYGYRLKKISEELMSQFTLEADENWSVKVDGELYDLDDYVGNYEETRFY